MDIDNDLVFLFKVALAVVDFVVTAESSISVEALSSDTDNDLVFLALADVDLVDATESSIAAIELSSDTDDDLDFLDLADVDLVVTVESSIPDVALPSDTDTVLVFLALADVDFVFATDSFISAESLSPDDDSVLVILFKATESFPCAQSSDTDNAGQSLSSDTDHDILRLVKIEDTLAGDAFPDESFVFSVGSIGGSSISFRFSTTDNTFSTGKGVGFEPAFVSFRSSETGKPSLVGDSAAFSSSVGGVISPGKRPR